MGTIKNLILALFLILIIAIFGNIILSTLGLFFDKDVLHLGYFSSDEPSANVKIIFVLKSIALSIFAYGFFVLISKLKLLSKGDFFNLDLIQSFSKTGKLFCISGALGIATSILTIFIIIYTKEIKHLNYLNIDSKSQYIMLMILGLFFLLFVKVLRKGNFIKQENDLTI